MKTVLCRGVFDLLHVNHVRHLQEAAEHGRLIVVLTPDKHVKKGHGRPIVPELDRMRMVEALRCVSEALLSQRETATEDILFLKPDFYAKGHEYRDNPTPMLDQEMEALRQVGGQMIFTSRQEGPSTTELIRLIKGCEPQAGPHMDE